MKRVERKAIEKRKKAAQRNAIVTTGVAALTIVSGIAYAQTQNTVSTQMPVKSSISDNNLKLVDTDFKEVKEYASKTIAEPVLVNKGINLKSIDPVQPIKSLEKSKIENFEENKIVETEINTAIMTEEKVTEVEVPSAIEELKTKGYIDFNGEGDFVSPIDIFNGSKVTISDRINPEREITKENEKDIFNPTKFSGTEVMIVDNDLYKLDIDDYCTISYEKIEDKATIDLFKNQIDRANSSDKSQETQYGELKRVQSSFAGLELTGIDLNKYDVQAMGLELDFAPAVLAETINSDGSVTAKYSGQMWYGDESFIVTDSENNIEGIYTIDNYDSPQLKKIQTAASIANILKEFEERNNRF